MNKIGNIVREIEEFSMCNNDFISERALFFKELIILNILLSIILETINALTMFA